MIPHHPTNLLRRSITSLLMLCMIAVYTYAQTPATFHWYLYDGGEDQPCTITGDPSLFYEPWYELSGMVFNGRNIPQNKPNPTRQDSLSLVRPIARMEAPSDAAKLEFFIVPRYDITYHVTRVSFDAIRVGTNEGRLSYQVQIGSTIERVDDVHPERYNAPSHYEIAIDADASVTAPIVISMYVYNLANNKNLGFANVHVEGSYTGALSSDRTYHTIHKEVLPANSGTIALTSSVIEDGTTLDLSAIPTEGYTFHQWYVNDIPAGTEYDPAHSLTVTQELNIRAEFMALDRITFRNNTDAKGICPDPTYSDHDHHFISPRNYTLSRFGYTHIGWTNGTDTFAVGSTITTDGDVTLYPVWRENVHSLTDLTAPLVVTWPFGLEDGAPVFNSEQDYYVVQATVEGELIDIALGIDQTTRYEVPGSTLTTSALLASVPGEHYARVNNNVYLRVPAIMGTQVQLTPDNGTTLALTTLDGDALTSAPYTITDGDNLTATIHIHEEDANKNLPYNPVHYFRSLTITYPRLYTITTATSPALNEADTLLPVGEVNLTNAPANCAPRYPLGYEIAIAQEPSYGYNFISLSTPNPLTVSDDVCVTATYTPRAMHSIQVQANRAARGTVALSPAHAKYVEGDEVTLIANPQLGYMLQGWRINNAGDTLDIPTYVMGTEDVTLTAIFVPNHGSYTITPMLHPSQPSTVQLPDAVSNTNGLYISSTHGTYWEGHTLLGYTDNIAYTAGDDYYPLGSTYIATADATLYPVFRVNPEESTLDGQHTDIVVEWWLSKNGGAEMINARAGQGRALTTRAHIEGMSADYDFDLQMRYQTTRSSQIINTIDDDWCKMTNGSKLTVPSCLGATIELETDSRITTTTIAGQVPTEYTQTADSYIYRYTVSSDEATADIVIGDDFGFYRRVRVTLPPVTQRVHRALIYTNFQDWQTHYGGTNVSVTQSYGGGVSTITTDYSVEQVPFTFVGSGVGDHLVQNDGRFPVTANPDFEGYIMAAKTSPSTLVAGPFKNVTRVRYSHAATGVNRGWGLRYYHVGEATKHVLNSTKVGTDLVWVDVQLGGDAGEDDVMLEFYNLDEANNAYMFNLEVYGWYDDPNIQYPLLTEVNNALWGRIVTIPEANDHLYNAKEQLSIHAVPADGYIFQHWETADGDSLTNVNPYLHTMTDTFYLQAVFEQAVCIHFNLSDYPEADDNGGAVPEDIFVQKGKPFTIPVNHSLYKEGYTLTQWRDIDDNIYLPGESYTLHESVVLYPVFRVNSLWLGDVTSTQIAGFALSVEKGGRALNMEEGKVLYVTQIDIDGQMTDIPLHITAHGKYDSQSTETRVQIADGSEFELPTSKASQVVFYCVGSSVDHMDINGVNTAVEGGNQPYYTIPSYTSPHRFVPHGTYYDSLQIIIPKPLLPPTITYVTTEANATITISDYNDPELHTSVYYTIDESDPTSDDLSHAILYTGPIVVTEKTFIKAIAINMDDPDSPIAANIATLRKPGRKSVAYLYDPTLHGYKVLEDKLYKALTDTTLFDYNVASINVKYDDYCKALLEPYDALIVSPTIRFDYSMAPEEAGRHIIYELITDTLTPILERKPILGLNMEMFEEWGWVSFDSLHTADVMQADRRPETLAKGLDGRNYRLFDKVLMDTTNYFTIFNSNGDDGMLYPIKAGINNLKRMSESMNSSTDHWGLDNYKEKMCGVAFPGDVWTYGEGMDIEYLYSIAAIGPRLIGLCMHPENLKSVNENGIQVFRNLLMMLFDAETAQDFQMSSSEPQLRDIRIQYIDEATISHERALTPQELGILSDGELNVTMKAIQKTVPTIYASVENGKVDVEPVDPTLIYSEHRLINTIRLFNSDSTELLRQYKVIYAGPVIEGNFTYQDEGRSTTVVEGNRETRVTDGIFTLHNEHGDIQGIEDDVFILEPGEYHIDVSPNVLVSQIEAVGEAGQPGVLTLLKDKDFRVGEQIPLTVTGGTARYMFHITFVDYNTGETPHLTDQSIADGATGVPCSGTIRLTFDAYLAPIMDGEFLPGQHIYTTGGTNLVDMQYWDLEPNTTYEFFIPAGTLNDEYGKQCMEDIRFSFTTGDATTTTVTKRLPNYILDADMHGATCDVDALFVDPNDDTQLIGHGDIAYVLGEAAVFTGRRFFVFFPDGEYNMGDINFDNLPASIIGQSMDGTIVHGSVNNISLDAVGHYQQDYTMQAPTHYAYSDRSKRSIFKNVRLVGKSDSTFYAISPNRLYMEDCEIVGNTDLLVGQGDIYLERCSLYLRQSNGTLLGPSTKYTQPWGMVLHDCYVAGADGTKLQGYFLGRPLGGSPAATLLDTRMQSAPTATGWTSGVPGLNLRLHEYNSRLEDGTTISTNSRTLRSLAPLNYDDPVLTEQESHMYTLRNVMGGTDAYDPTIYTKQCLVSGFALNEDSLIWDDDDETMYWILLRSETEDGPYRFYAATTSTHIDLRALYTDEDGNYLDPTKKGEGYYRLRAANLRGGLGPESETVHYIPGVSFPANVTHTNSDPSGYGWSTICLPENVRLTDVMEDELAAYAVTSVTDKVMYLDRVRSLDKTRGYVLYGKVLTGANYNLYQTSIPAEYETLLDGNATDAPISVGSKQVFTLDYGSYGLGFYQYRGVLLLPYKAYLDASLISAGLPGGPSMAPRQMVIRGGMPGRQDVATGFEEVINDNDNDNGNAVSDRDNNGDDTTITKQLQGEQIIIRRGGRTYDILGRER